MSRLDRYRNQDAPEGEAVLKFEGSSYRILKMGSYVRCAVTGAPIALSDLKYWNLERGEAYASTEASLKSHLDHLSAPVGAADLRESRK